MQNDNKSGHIKHEDIDMDTHDRAVRRNAGSRSRRSGHPVLRRAALAHLHPDLRRGRGILSDPSLLQDEAGRERPGGAYFPRASGDGGSCAPRRRRSPIPSLPSDRGGLLIVEGAESTAEPAGAADTAGAADAEAGSADILLTQEPVPTPTPTPSVHVHSFVKGVCSVCGAKPEFLTGLAAGRILSGGGTRRNRDRGGIRHKGLRRL